MGFQSAAPGAPFVLLGVGRIPLRDRHGKVRAYATVDLADFRDVRSHRWHLDSTGYAVRNVRFGPRRDNKSMHLFMHRHLLGLARGDRRQADHISRRKLDNRRANLRVVAGDAENRQNQPSRGGTSKHRGVFYDTRRGRWVACARLSGKHRHIGYFLSEDAAAEAARAWRREYMPFATD